MNYAEHLSQHRRITILRILERSPGYKANESILCDSLNALGVTSTRDQVRTELAWLADQGLLTTEDLQGLSIATVTERGFDVARGLSTVPGVPRPSPAR